MIPSFAVYCPYIDQDSIVIVSSLKKYVNNKYEYNDFAIFVDDIPNTETGSAMLPSFYMRFYKGSVIFTKLEDYLVNKDKLLSDNKFVITNPTELTQNGLSKKELSTENTIILQNINGAIYEV
jgi:hypothetical protein